MKCIFLCKIDLQSDTKMGYQAEVIRWNSIDNYGFPGICSTIFL